MSDLGHADKFVASKNSTIVMRENSEQDVEAIEGRIAELWAQHDETENKG
jgi:hypothetical protein